MKFKAIIFDFDGVLFDSEKFHLQACNEVFKSLGFNIPEHEYFQHYVGLSDREMFPLILNIKKIEIKHDPLKILINKKIETYKKIIDGKKTLAGFLNVKTFINKYFKRIEHFAICSGSTKIELETVLNKLEGGQLKKFFNPIITSENVSIGKPSPEGYLLTAKQLGLLPEHCLAIEDTQKGASAAKTAGMRVAALSISNSNYKNVDLIAKSYDEIDNWVSELA
mgnify:CR=1 FL=1